MKSHLQQQQQKQHLKWERQDINAFGAQLSKELSCCYIFYFDFVFIHPNTHSLNNEHVEKGL